MSPGRRSHPTHISEEGLPRDRVTLRFVASPQDANISGDHVAAGSILEWIDKAGYVCAVGWGSTYCVTAYVGNVHFTRPIRPGEVIEAAAQVVHTGRTSMQILVRLRSADVRRRDYEPAMHCLLVFVAVDENGVPIPVPAWAPSSKEDKSLEHNAQLRVALRHEIRAEMRNAVFSDAGTTPRAVFRFLALPRVANFGGNAHGGTVMRWINEAAYACAAGWSQSVDIAMIYTGGVHFYRPIRIGDVVEVDARLLHTTATEMHISVHVRSADPRHPEEPQLCTQCIAVFTRRCLTDELPLPQLALNSQEDRDLNNLARRLIDMRATLPRVPAGHA